MFNEYNATAGKYEYKPTNEDVFLSLSEFYNAVNDKDFEATYRIHGVFFFNTEYGKSGAVIYDECYIYLPMSMIATFESINGDEAASNALAQGLCGFTMNKYKAHGKICTGMRLVDIPADFTPTNTLESNGVTTL